MNKAPNAGFLLVVDGIDGSGKGGVVRRSVEFLKTKTDYGPDSVVQTKEPGGTEIGDQIREVIFGKPGTRAMIEGVPDLLFLASHLQNLGQVVRPSLDAGKAVVTDRWWYSQESYAKARVVPAPIDSAYQLMRGQDADLFIFLYGDPQVLVGRANARTTETHQANKAWNDVIKLGRIQDTYFELFTRRPEFCPVCVDNRNEEQVFAEVQRRIADALQNRRLW